MINFLRQIRRRLADENQFLKYSRYAIGEIVLVMIGILIALQINNWNEGQKEEKRELNYLVNVKNDLEKSVVQIENYIEKRNTQIESSRIVLEHFDGKPIENPEEFNIHTINVYTWRKFFLTLNTYKELTNSGQLSLISNDSIKAGLMDLESNYHVMKDEEDHFRFDAENLLYLPQFETIDMNPLVQNYTYQMSNGQAGENVDISEERVVLNLDPDRIRQALGNLLGNALRYTPEGGTIYVSLRTVAQNCQIQIRDTGAGISPEDLPNVFERFYRSDASRNRDLPGAGLGLPIAQALIRAHGGEIEVESPGVGKGSTLTVRLPIR